MSEARARVEANLIADGISVWIVEGVPGSRYQLIWDNGPMPVHKRYDAGTAPAETSLVLPEGVARALLDALLDHYGHATGGRLQRADFEHERKRRDLLEDGLLDLLKEAMTE